MQTRVDPADRVVIRMPFDELWDDTGALRSRYLRYLSLENLRAILKNGPIEFVVAFVSFRLAWIPEQSCFKFWKAEVRPHLFVDESDPRRDEEFPDGYGFVASEWECEGRAKSVVLLAAGEGNLPRRYKDFER